MRKTIVFSIVFLIHTSSCTCDKYPSQLYQPTTLFTLLDFAKTGIGFTNVIDDTSGISYFTSSYTYNDGVAVGDLNNDDFQDLVFTGTQASEKIYAN